MYTPASTYTYTYSYSSIETPEQKEIRQLIEEPPMSQFHYGTTQQGRKIEYHGVSTDSAKTYHVRSGRWTPFKRVIDVCERCQNSLD